MTKVLVTGFDPFGGERVNPALEAVKILQDKQFEGIELVTSEVPTVFYRSIAVLEQLIDTERPDVVICVGQAGGRPDVTVERVAINVDDARIADNAGNKPIDAPIVADGPAAYWSGLPIKAIVQNMRQAGIPASVSQTAGTFVCNHLFYGLMNLIAEKYPTMRGGFIHIPFLPEQTIRKPGQPCMSIADIVRGLEVAVRTSVEVQQDIQVSGGQIS
jgi:pyroglutamyl-peptidase